MEIFCINIFFGLLNAIAGNADVFVKMSPKERRSYFGTEDGSIPEYEVVELARTWRSERSAKKPVYITFDAHGTRSTATLYVVEDHDLMSRRLTGVWFATSSPNAYQKVHYDPWPSIFDELGRFEFLQNVEEGSAVTRFWESNGKENIIGILKHNYTVKSIPKEFEHAFIDTSNKHGLGQRSMNSMNDQEKERLFLTVFKNSGSLQEYFRRHTYAKNDALPDPRLHRAKRRRTTPPRKVPKVVYPKLLIIPEFNAVKRYPHYLDFFKQLISQLNTVDMTYRQLKDPRVHLNIAGIIIPWDDEATPYIKKFTAADSRIDSDLVLEEANLHFWNEQRRFPHDNWDSILILTTNLITSYNDYVGGPVTINGVSGLAGGCTGASTLVKFTENMDGVYTWAHELGHVFGVLHDEDENGRCKNSDGYLMVSANNHAKKFEWSTCSRAAFQRFFRSDKGNCAYSRPKKIPDALKRMPGAWLPIKGQCDNLYNDSTNSCMDNNPISCTSYGCERDGTCDWIFDSPMEGSLLDDDNGLQACINRRLIPV